jgi:hypothetical protein
VWRGDIVRLPEVAGFFCHKMLLNSVSYWDDVADVELYTRVPGSETNPTLPLDVPMGTAKPLPTLLAEQGAG